MSPFDRFLQLRRPKAADPSDVDDSDALSGEKASRDSAEQEKASLKNGETVEVVREADLVSPGQLTLDEGTCSVVHGQVTRAHAYTLQMRREAWVVTWACSVARS